MKVIVSLVGSYAEKVGFEGDRIKLLEGGHLLILNDKKVVGSVASGKWSHYEILQEDGLVPMEEEADG